MNKSEGSLCTVDEAAKELAVSIATVKEFIRLYGPSARRGRKPMVHLERIRPWLEDRTSACRTFQWFMDNCPDE